MSLMDRDQSTQSYTCFIYSTYLDRKDEELARAKAERDAEAARRALERKLQLQDKVGAREVVCGMCAAGGSRSGCSCSQSRPHMVLCPYSATAQPRADRLDASLPNPSCRS